MLPHCSRVEHVSVVGDLTDHHHAPLLSIDFQRPIGPGFWSLNKDYLYKSGFILRVRDIIVQYSAHEAPKKWDELKDKIKYNHGESYRNKRTCAFLRR